MRNLFLLVFVLSSIYGHAQYYKAEILLKDGYSKTGYAKLPASRLLASGIKFKNSLDENSEKIEDDDIFQIIYTTDQGTDFLFERNHMVYLQKAFGKVWEKEIKTKAWMVLIHTNPVIQQFAAGQQFSISKDGENISITSKEASIYILFKKIRESNASIVDADLYSYSMKRKALAIYFKDHPEFVKRIESKEFNRSSPSEIADAFFDSL